MSFDWSPIKVRDLGRIVTGKTPPTSQSGNFGGKIPFLTPTDMLNGRKQVSTSRTLTEEGVSAVRNCLIPKGVAVSCIGWQMGKSVLVTEPTVTNQQINTIVVDEARFDSAYVYYLMNSMRAKIFELGATPTRTPIVNKTTFGNIDIFVPRLAEQRAISAICAGFDERISLLRDTNATLEAIAQALFKSWFVDFDPVRAKMESRVPEGMDEATAALFPDRLEESELGAVPRGWVLKTLSGAFEINPKRSLKKGAMAPYLDMASLATSGHCVEPPVQREMGSGAKFRNGDTLLARITPCLENGKSAFVDFLAESEIGWGSTEFVVLRPKAPLPEYFGYLLCRHQSFRDHAISSMSGTSGRQRIQNDVLERYLLAMPDVAVASAFTEIVEPVQRSIAANHQMAQTLVSLRDALLPRLISGQLRLPDLENQIQAIAA